MSAVPETNGKRSATAGLRARVVDGAARVPPHDLDAEAAVLSSVLLTGEAFDRVREMLSAEHFYSEANRRIFEAVAALHGASSPVDLVTVMGWLRDRNRLGQVGGSPYLAQLVDATPAVAHVEHHAARVLALAEQRGTLATAQALAAAIYTGDVEAATTLRAEISRSIPVAAPFRSPITIPTVIGAWRDEGPLVHESTGIETLDQLTGGGPVYGTRWYLAGAPDAGKTALLVQIAHVFVQRGIAVGLLAVDEEAGDLVTRFAQRVGYSREHCEIRDPSVLAQIASELESLPIRFYDGGWTIESAARDLADFAASIRARAMLGVDSIQTVACDAELATLVGGGRELNTSEAVTARARAIRVVATRYRMITLATSELNRAAYASGDPDKQSATLAAAKWSGAIEYSARVLLGLRSVAGEKDLLEIELAKNKHGARDVNLYVRIDRRSQTLTEANFEAPPDAREAARASAREERSRAEIDGAAGWVAVVLAEKPGITTRNLAPEVRARSSTVTRERAAIGLAALGDAVTVIPGPRGAERHYLDGSRVPVAVLASVPAARRGVVEGARVPLQNPEGQP